MSWFKCKHPFDKLEIARAETETKIDEDFQNVDYHLKCVKCGQLLRMYYTRCTGGTEALLARKYFQRLEQEEKSK